MQSNQSDFLNTALDLFQRVSQVRASVDKVYVTINENNLTVEHPLDKQINETLTRLCDNLSEKVVDYGMTYKVPGIAQSHKVYLLDDKTKNLYTTETDRVNLKIVYLRDILKNLILPYYRAEDGTLIPASKYGITKEEPKKEKPKGAWEAKYKEEEVMSRNDWENFVVREIKYIRKEKMKFDCADFYLYLIAKYYKFKKVKFSYTGPYTGTKYSSSDDIFSSFEEFIWGIKTKKSGSELFRGLLGLTAEQLLDGIFKDDFFLEKVGKTINVKEKIRIGNASNDGGHVQVHIPNAKLYTIYNSEIDGNEEWREKYLKDKDSVMQISGSLPEIVPKMYGYEADKYHYLMRPKFLSRVKKLLPIDKIEPKKIDKI